MQGEIIKLAEEAVAQALVFHETRVMPSRHSPVGNAIARIPAADAFRLGLSSFGRQHFIAHIKTAAARANICADPAAQAALCHFRPKVVIKPGWPYFLGRDFQWAFLRR